jgi:hypothetical protein
VRGRDDAQQPDRQQPAQAPLRDQPGLGAVRPAKNRPAARIATDSSGARRLRGHARTPRVNIGRPKPLQQPARDNDQPRTALPDIARGIERHIHVRDKGRDIALSTEEAKAVRDIGAFRALRVEDLGRVTAPTMRDKAALDRLGRAGVTRYVGRPGAPKHVTLTTTGARLARQLPADGRQAAMYAGAKRVRDLPHDAAIYQAYLVAKNDTEKAGGRVVSVKLDDELRKNVNQDLAKDSANGAEPSAARVKEVAARYNLVVQDDSINYPDAQLEIERPDASRATINLEVITEHYSGKSIAAKAAAGFQLFSPGTLGSTRIGGVDGGGGHGRNTAPVRSLADELLAL